MTLPMHDSAAEALNVLAGVGDHVCVEIDQLQFGRQGSRRRLAQLGAVVDVLQIVEKLFTQLDEIDQGRRPEPNLLDVEDEARTIALQMEQVISDIGQYGSMLNRITSFQPRINRLTLNWRNPDR